MEEGKEKGRGKWRRQEKGKEKEGRDREKGERWGREKGKEGSSSMTQWTKQVILLSGSGLTLKYPTASLLGSSGSREPLPRWRGKVWSRSVKWSKNSSSSLSYICSGGMRGRRDETEKTEGEEKRREESERGGEEGREKERRREEDESVERTGVCVWVGGWVCRWVWVGMHTFMLS